MTSRDQYNPWPRIGWWSAAALVGVSFALGFIVLGRYQQNGPTLDTWNAICRTIGITADTAPASEPQPPLRTPTEIAWTSAPLARVASGNQQHGAFIALNCSTCHGEQGISPTSLIPTLAGMEAAVIYKQLSDYRSGKRLWGVMSAMAGALSDQDFADVAAWFAHREAPGVAQTGHKQDDPTIRLIFAGDPGRGLPPCAACHGPAGHKLGAPLLRGQHTDYIERQLEAFAQGTRRNDINQQMRTIAGQLVPAEMHAVAAWYGAERAAGVAEVSPRVFDPGGRSPNQNESNVSRAGGSPNVLRVDPAAPMKAGN